MLPLESSDAPLLPRWQISTEAHVMEYIREVSRVYYVLQIFTREPEVAVLFLYFVCVTRQCDFSGKGISQTVAHFRS